MLQLLEYGVAAIITPTKTFHVFLRNATLQRESELAPQDKEDSQNEANDGKNDNKVIELDKETIGKHCTDCDEKFELIHQLLGEIKARIQKSEMQEQSK